MQAGNVIGYSVNTISEYRTPQRLNVHCDYVHIPEQTHPVRDGLKIQLRT